MPMQTKKAQLTLSLPVLVTAVKPTNNVEDTTTVTREPKPYTAVCTIGDVSDTASNIYSMIIGRSSEHCLDQAARNGTEASYIVQIIDPKVSLLHLQLYYDKERGAWMLQEFGTTKCVQILSGAGWNYFGKGTYLMKPGRHRIRIGDTFLIIDAQ